MRSPGKFGVALLTALVAACAGETVMVPTTPAPATTQPVTPLQAVVPDGPLVPQGSVDGADYLFVSAAVSAEAMVHAYIIGFRDDQSRVMVMSWEADGQVEQADAGVDQLDLDLEHPGPMPTSVTQQRDGTWVMHGFGVPNTIGATPVFWRAASDSPTGPWRDPTIVYEVGGPGAWDGAWIDFPTVLEIGEELFMLYEGASAADRNSSHLGIATSPDGIAWAHPDAPALSPDDCPDVTSIRAPRLLSTDAGWLFAFAAITGRDEEPPIRLGMQDDPLQLSCQDVGTVLNADDLPSSGGIHSHALIETASGPALLVESLTPDASASALWLVPLAS